MKLNSSNNLTSAQSGEALGRNFLCYIQTCSTKSEGICNQEWRSRWGRKYGCGRHFCSSHGDTNNARTSKDHHTGICSECIRRRWNRDCKEEFFIFLTVFGLFVVILFFSVILPVCILGWLKYNKQARNFLQRSSANWSFKLLNWPHILTWCFRFEENF